MNKGGLQNLLRRLLHRNAPRPNAQLIPAKRLAVKIRIFFAIVIPPFWGPHPSPRPHRNTCVTTAFIPAADQGKGLPDVPQNVWYRLPCYRRTVSVCLWWGRGVPLKFADCLRPSTLWPFRGAGGAARQPQSSHGAPCQTRVSTLL